MIQAFVWTSVECSHAHLDGELNNLEANGWEICHLLPKTGSFGAYNLLIVARKPKLRK